MSQYKIVTDKSGNNYTLHIKNAVLKYRNFGGGDYGVSCSVEISRPATAQRLINDGWNLKCDKIDKDAGNERWQPFEEKPDGEIAIPYTDLAIKFHNDPENPWRDPEIIVYKDADDAIGKRYWEDELYKLDEMRIKKCNIDIRPRKATMKGYLKKMEVWLMPSIYDDPDGWDGDDEEDEVPFA